MKSQVPHARSCPEIGASAKAAILSCHDFKEARGAATPSGAGPTEADATETSSCSSSPFQQLLHDCLC